MRLNFEESRLENFYLFGREYLNHEQIAFEKIIFV